MDPLHPLVPIQPAPPVPPDYTRVQRIERDHQRESAPDWQGPAEEDDEEQREEQFEDDYDPDWSDKTAEAYNDHGELTEHPGTRANPLPSRDASALEPAPAGRAAGPPTRLRPTRS